MCNELRIKLTPVAFNDHEANGSIESANRDLRHIYLRLRSENSTPSLSCILSESTCGKNMTKGNKLASSFEILYGRYPPILTNVPDKRPIVTLDQHKAHISKTRIQKCLNIKSELL